MNSSSRSGRSMTVVPGTLQKHCSKPNTILPLKNATVPFKTNKQTNNHTPTPLSTNITPEQANHSRLNIEKAVNYIIKIG